MSHALAVGQSAIEQFREIELPAELQANFRRHRANLARLVRALQVAGVDERQIEASANAVVASYRAELLNAIKKMNNTADHV